MFFLISCSGTIFDKTPAPVIVTNASPQWPVAGPRVAKDLEQCCLPAEKYTALWEWLARLEKHHDQL